MNGRLIGINRMIVSPSGASSGIGFAIPSNLVRVVVAAAESGGPAQRPWLGAELQEVTPEIAASLGLDVPGGALVASVDDGRPAAKAGLKSGDLIESFDGSPIDDVGGFTYQHGDPAGRRQRQAWRRARRQALHRNDRARSGAGNRRRATSAISPAIRRWPASPSSICRPRSPTNSPTPARRKASSSATWRKGRTPTKLASRAAT